MDAHARKRIVFMGTPPFAARILESVAGWQQGELVAVYTQPDRPAKRGKRLLASAVKCLAEELHVPVVQPETLKGTDAYAVLSGFKPDFLLVAAYGMLLPEKILAVPAYPPLNVHASLLPRYRGAAPVQRAVMDQDAAHPLCGISIMQMVKALDAGPVYLQKSLPIQEHTADSLLEALAPLGAEALLEVMDAMVSGRAVCVEQDEEQVTYAQKLEKKDGYIDFEKSAERVHAHIRAVTSWPGAQCTIHIDSLKKAISVTMLPGRQGEPCDCPPGTVYLGKGGTIQIACTDVWYILGKVKPKGKAFMETSAFVNGYVREVPQGICGYVVRP